MRSVTLCAVLLLATAPARADVWADLAADGHAVTQLDGARRDVEARQQTLARDSATLAADIERTKGESGVRRDGKLQELLASQKQKSDELERLASELRGRASLVAGARRKLIADCDRALATPNLPEARRLELARLRTTHAAALAAPAAPIGVARATDDPLDGPRELQDKADLLRDSGDKLRREVVRLAARIDGVERRRHLRERAGAVDEDLFGEAVSNRRSPRVASTTFGGSHGGAADNATGANSPTAGPSQGQGGGGAGGSAGGGAGSPAPGSGGTGGTTGGSNGGSTGGGSTGGTLGGTGSGDSTVLRNLVDPATLDELRRSDGSDDLDRQLRALRRAQGELNGLATELDRRARALSQRADELKHKK
ncbi:MAG TPA: hypothetical protein VN947_35775 [Polyangia bacterium]|nr:hypothetical protein [Polyangia bacterium]